MANSTANETSVPSRERTVPGSVNITPFTDWPATATSESVDANKIAQEVIGRFNDAVSKNDHSSVAGLFLGNNSFWRDHLALTWGLRTLQGRDKILEYLKSSTSPLTRIDIDSSAAHKAPHIGPIDAWGDVKGIQFFVKFETAVGRGEGFASLAEHNGAWKIFMISTVLKELKGYEEPTGKRRAKGVEHGGNPDRRNWLETREKEKNFEGVEPTVLIIGKPF